MPESNMRRCEAFDFSRRYGDQIEGEPIPWTIELAGPDGAHYHFWLPRCNAIELAQWKVRAKRAARRKGDPVSFSFDFLPATGGQDV